jgi:putative oxidoreductase
MPKRRSLTSSTHAVTHPGRSSSTRATVLDWGLRVVLAVFFVGTAIPKLANITSATQMFAEIGAGHWLQYVVGAAELAGAIGLLIPPLTGLAATGLCLDMIGASVINATILHSTAIWITLVLAVVFAALAYRHRPRMRPHSHCQPATTGATWNQSHERLDELLAALQANTDT